MTTTNNSSNVQLNKSSLFPPPNTAAAPKQIHMKIKGSQTGSDTSTVKRGSVGTAALTKQGFGSVLSGSGDASWRFCRGSAALSPAEQPWMAPINTAARESFWHTRSKCLRTQPWNQTLHSFWFLTHWPAPPPVQPPLPPFSLQLCLD